MVLASGEASLIFLGGLGEVGKNLFLVETDDDIAVIDFGLGFPDETQHGVDVVLPDIDYLAQRREKVRGIYITHGHEDHIGALPYLWPEVRAPIHATRLTAGLIEAKLREAGLERQALVQVFDPDEHPVLHAGSLAIEPFRVTHSIPDAVGFGIDTPGGLIVHTSDFKFDPTPVDGKPTDYGKIEELGRRGVRLLISDSVHIESRGETPSERVIGETYDEVFGQAQGRIIVATFASLIARIQQVIDVAGSHGRKVAPLGRSLTGNVKIALELGYLSDPEGVLIDGRDASGIAEDRIVYVVTGSQGEPMAVLSRIANRDHHEIEIHRGDTVVVSATPIPGNETSVYRIIDQLFHQGAAVIYSALARVHVSGHASRDELRRMIDMVQPQHVLPTHGEYRHLALYADLAREAGIPDERIHMVGPGDVVAISDAGVMLDGEVETGAIFVEGRAMDTVTVETLDQRHQIATEGLVTIAVAIDPEAGEVVAGPRLTAVGMVMRLDEGLRDEMLVALRESIETMLARGLSDHARIGRRIENIVASYVYRGHRRRPRIHPMILDVTGRHT
jgi:ribonuclease J